MKMEQKYDLLILDVHGIILNAYWPDFLHEVAHYLGEPYEQVNRRWREHIREDAWLGRIDDEELWQRLTYSSAGECDWRGLLEAGYALDSGAERVPAWAEAVPTWLLSNHRSHWLMPRLERFGLLDHFERVLVSDRINAVKPQAEAFQELLGHVSDPSRVLFVDDHLDNIATARRYGIDTVFAEEGTPWASRVDEMLGLLQVNHSAH